jgi:hypothetical protein
MQPNTVTLAVDVLNNGTTEDQIYTRYEEYQNRASYIGASHTPDSRDALAIYRTFPTKTGNFKGVAKSAVKFTKDVEVSGVDSSTTLTAPIIFDLSASIPVGATTADVLEARQRLIALLDNDTFMNSLNIQLMV